MKRKGNGDRQKPRGARPVESAGERGSRFGFAQFLLVVLVIGTIAAAAHTGLQWWQRAPAQELSRMDALQQVRVQGPFRAVTQAELEEILLPYLQRGFFALDIQALRRALLRHPWIVEASVSRRWPRGVEVIVEEAQPLAIWGGDKLLVTSGDLLPRPEQMPVARLPELAGESELVERIMAQYQALAGLLTTRDMEVRRLSFDDLAGWQLELVSGIQLRLGHDELLERINRFLALSRGVLAPHLERIARVDARYSNAIAVEWKENL